MYENNGVGAYPAKHFDKRRVGYTDCFVVWSEDEHVREMHVFINLSEAARLVDQLGSIK
jgi:hypothetical protein